jgi:Protein of unknown function (DUF3558)
VGDVPKVQAPLPASVLEGSPCDTAFTADQIRFFITASKPANRRDDFATGPKCNWVNADGNGASIAVSYMTKLGGGLDVAYQNTKPQTSRFEPIKVGDYPAVIVELRGTEGLRDQVCGLFVGVRDDLMYSVDMTLGENARKNRVDPCEAAKEVANTVLTNLKGRA